MWFNFRKPRPTKRGAYYYAAKFQMPVISCFVEMIDENEVDRDDFMKVRYRIHVLPLIYPDPNLSIRDNSVLMNEKDYQQKKEAYEKAYGKELEYSFDKADIAGWMPSEKESA